MRYNSVGIVEYRAFNTGVLGSSPNASTICRDGEMANAAGLEPVL